MQSRVLKGSFWLYCAVIATLAFGVLGLLYTLGGPLERVDYWLGAVLHDVLDVLGSRVARLMSILSWFGGRGALVVTAVVALFLAVRRSWVELLLLLTAVGGAIVLNRLLKEAFESVRPMVGHMYIAEESTGFPSGHAMAAFVVYGVLAFLVVTRDTLRRFHGWAWMAAGALVLFISFTRLFLSVHYLSDVLGGLAAGLAWLSLCLWAYCTLTSGRALRLRIRQKIIEPLS